MSSKIIVAVYSPPSGLIVNEYVPLGWNLVSANPAYESYDAQIGLIKWLFYSGSVQSCTITYTLAVPSSANGEKIFTGNIKYNNPNHIEVPIGGDTKVSDTQKICIKGDTNCDNAITPGDALLAFMIYLGSHTPSGQEICDVLCASDFDSSGYITPGDALCIFREFLADPC